MEQQYLIKNTEDKKYFSAGNLNLDPGQREIDFVELGEATPLNKEQANEVLGYLRAINKDLPIKMEELNPDLAKIMTNNFDISKVFNPNELKKLNLMLATVFEDKILIMYNKCAAIQPGFAQLPINAAVSNLLNVGLSQISDPRYTSCNKRLGKLIDNNKNGTKYFKIYSLLIELGITSLTKDITGA